MAGAVESTMGRMRQRRRFVFAHSTVGFDGMHMSDKVGVTNTRAVGHNANRF